MQLKVYGDKLTAKMRELSSKRLCLTINSDDPPFFGGHTTENLEFWVDELRLSEGKILELVFNSIEASFLDIERKERLRRELTRTFLHKL